MDFKCYSELDYSEFARTINIKLEQERIPISGTLELTRRCNLSCIHCYCNQPANSQEIQKKELSTQDTFKILDDIARKGCLWLLFTGGEPLLRRDFKEIYLHAKKRGFIITLFTNATLITGEIAEFLKEWPPHKVEVTLYGASRQVYEKVTGVGGSFDKCMEGINYLLEKNIHLSLKTMVSTINIHELWQIKDFAKKRGLSFRYDSLLHPRIDGSRIPCEYRVPSDKVAFLDIEDSERLKGWQKFLEYSKNFKKTKYLYQCGAGRDSFSIDPYGDVSICSMVMEHVYNIREYAFDYIWDSFSKALKKEYGSSFECGTCSAEVFCQTCPGWGMIEHGDPEAKVDYLCEAAHKRKELFEKLTKKGGLYGKEKLFKTSN